MSLYGRWLPATIASGGTSSDAVNLGMDADAVCIQLPTLTSCTIKLQVAEESGGTYQDLGSGVTTATTTGAYNTMLKAGGYSHIKVVSSAAQGAERLIRVRGMKI